MLNDGGSTEHVMSIVFLPDGRVLRQKSTAVKVSAEKKLWSASLVTKMTYQATARQAAQDVFYMILGSRLENLKHRIINVGCVTDPKYSLTVYVIRIRQEVTLNPSCFTEISPMWYYELEDDMRLWPQRYGEITKEAFRTFNILGPNVRKYIGD